MCYSSEVIDYSVCFIKKEHKGINRNPEGAEAVPGWWCTETVRISS